MLQGHYFAIVIQGSNIAVLGNPRSSSQVRTSRDCIYPSVDRWRPRRWVRGQLRGSCWVWTLGILWSGPARILVQVAQFDKIFNLILQMSALVSVVSDVVVETTEFSGVSLGPIPSQRLRSAVVDLLFSGDENVLSGVHQFRVLGILGNISVVLCPSSSCRRGGLVLTIFTPRSSPGVIRCPSQ